MKKREAEALAASKPVFLTKKQRETLALKRREVSFMSAAPHVCISSCLLHLQSSILLSVRSSVRRSPSNVARSASCLLHLQSSILLSSCLQHLQVGRCILASRRKALARGGSMARLIVFRCSAVLLLKHSMRNLKSVSSQ